MSNDRFKFRVWDNAEKTYVDSKLNPVVMPYRNLDGDGQITNQEIKHVARWCNRVTLRKSCSYKEYRHETKEEL